MDNKETNTIKTILKKQKSTLSYSLKEPKRPYQDAKGRGPHVPVDLIHPLVADGTGRDDQGGSRWHRLHCNEAVGAVERLNLQILLLIIHTLCMLPQVAVQALNTRLPVHVVEFTTYTLKAIIRWITDTRDIRMWCVTACRVERFSLVLCCTFLLDFKDTCAFGRGNISNTRVTSGWTAVLWTEIDARRTFPLLRGRSKLFLHLTTISPGLIVVIVGVLVIIRGVWWQVLGVRVLAHWLPGFFLDFPWAPHCLWKPLFNQFISTSYSSEIEFPTLFMRFT